MKVVEAVNAHEALENGMRLLKQEGIRRKSRAGDVLLMDGPVTTLYHTPNERVVFWPERDANPFFHFMEGLWMLAGRNDVGWISQFSSNIAQFSDDGETFHGAYGHRWMNHFVINVAKEDEEPTYVPFNQLERVIDMLKENPDERRCVVSMWDAEIDLGRKGKDIPCNLLIMFSVSVAGALDMTVCNRSNDIIWGAYGANVVHFSMLHEFMAAAIGVPLGRYWQISNNYHAYVEVFEKHLPLLDRSYYNPYLAMQVEAFPMVNGDPKTWLEDLLMFVEEGPVVGFRDKFFRRVATPIYSAWFAFKDKDDRQRIDSALEIMQQCAATDWRVAIVEWLERRRKK